MLSTRRTPTMLTIAAAAEAIATAAVTRRRFRRLGAFTAASTLSSNPGGGSASAARGVSASAASARSPTRARHGPHSLVCTSASARSGPPSIPNASSGASSRTALHADPLMVAPSFGVLRGERRPPPQQRGSDARLRRAERDVLRLAHLARGVPPEARHHERAPLLDRELHQRRAEAVGVVAQRRELVRQRATGAQVQGEDRIGVDDDWSAHPDRVDRKIPRDREEPGRDRAPAGVVGAGVSPRPHERLLGDVLGRPRVSEDRHGQAEDAALEPLHERRGRVGVPRRQACEQRIVGDSPHRDYAPAPRWDWGSVPITVALPARPTYVLRNPWPKKPPRGRAWAWK